MKVWQTLLIRQVPSEQGVYECADAAYSYLTKFCKIPEHKIILYGTSLGSGPTLYLASKHPHVKAVILEAPFTSVVRTKTDFFAARWLDMFLNYSRIGQVEGHLLIFHGEEDVVVPIGKLSCIFYYFRAWQGALQFVQKQIRFTLDTNSRTQQH